MRASTYGPFHTTHPQLLLRPGNSTTTETSVHDTLVGCYPSYSALAGPTIHQHVTRMVWGTHSCVLSMLVGRILSPLSKPLMVYHWPLTSEPTGPKSLLNSKIEVIQWNHHEEHCGLSAYAITAGRETSKMEVRAWVLERHTG